MTAPTPGLGDPAGALDAALGPRPITTGCCRHLSGCPAHAAGDCTWQPPATTIAADPAVAALLEALVGPDWPDRLAEHAARSGAAQ